MVRRTPARPPRRRLRGKAALAVAMVLALAAGEDALAAPYVGEGTAPIADGGDRIGPRREALKKARAAALEAALAELGAVDPEGRSRILATAAAWTSAYRILRQSDDGATATVEVEVEIDLPRLEKLLAGAATPASGAPPPRLGEIRIDGCGDEVDQGGVRELMVARGLASVEGPAPGVMRVALRCEELGEVHQARAHGAKVSLSTQVDGAPPQVSDALAFAADPSAAALEALRSALAGLSDTIRRERDTTIALEIAAPWPAARIRRLERAIRSSVVGVRSVGVGGITRGGAVILRIDGGDALVAEDLAARVQALKVPGAPLRIVEVQGPRRIAATFSAE
ncbi:MAG: hypothetical protein KC486_31745 [Myxococcales bacterium]|nr:hypothetical protein [Myxococcales bacterium]